jgi:large subunit ribosomal protein L6
MSRIGKKPIIVPKGIDIKIDGPKVSVKGPKGTLTRTIHSSMKLEVKENQVIVSPVTEEYEFRKFHGLTRSLVSNMVTGVSQGFSKNLKLVGVGYRAALQGKELQLSLGFSHPVLYSIPQGIEVVVDKQTTISVSGPDKELVGQAAANIRSFRKPEPYHGKGVRYEDEVILTKVGKSAGKK